MDWKREGDRTSSLAQAHAMFPMSCGFPFVTIQAALLSTAPKIASFRSPSFAREWTMLETSRVPKYLMSFETMPASSSRKTWNCQRIQ